MIIDQAPKQPTPVGAIRFNTDSSKMETYDGNQWVNISSTSPDQQTGGGRGFFAGGESPSIVDTIDYINISSTGNAADFGDLLSAARQLGGISDSHGGLGE